MENLQTHAVDILLDIVVPEAQHLETLPLEAPVPFGIARRLRMLAAVDFDDQPRLEAGEIEDIAVERNLTLEFQAFELLVAQRLPQFSALVAWARIFRAKMLCGGGTAWRILERPLSGKF